MEDSRLINNRLIVWLCVALVDDVSNCLSCKDVFYSNLKLIAEQNLEYHEEKLVSCNIGLARKSSTHEDVMGILVERIQIKQKQFGRCCKPNYFVYMPLREVEKVAEILADVVYGENDKALEKVQRILDQNVESDYSVNSTDKHFPQQSDTGPPIL